MSPRLRDRVESEATRMMRERLARLKQSIDESIAGLGEPMSFPLTPGEWGQAEGTAQMQALRDGIEAVSLGAGQREILAALLDAAAAFYPRTALFVVRGGQFHGWAGLGFLGDGGVGSDDLPRVTFPLAGDHLLAQATQRRSLTSAGPPGPGKVVMAALGGTTPQTSVAMPLVVRGRVAGVLYADSGTGGAAGPSVALEILARSAGLAMDRLVPPGVRPGQPAGAPGDETTAARPPRNGTPPPGRPTAPEEAELQALLGDLGGHPRRTGGDDGLSDEERRRLADAKRFAQLLVSELLLYNEEAVVLGRKKRDLQARLHKEIDRSRQAYRKRVGEQNDPASGFFDDELVRVLAQGDPGLLGN